MLSFMGQGGNDERLHTMADKSDIVWMAVLGPLEEMLERGDLPPWAKPWKASGRMAHRGANNRPYTNVNQMLTTIVAEINGYKSRRWWTYKAINAAGGRITKGEHGTNIVGWFDKKGERTKANGDVEAYSFMMPRYYKVWNLDQTDLPDDTKYPDGADDGETLDPIESCQAIVEGYKDRPKILHGFDHACYRPPRDMIEMPDMQDFISPEAYYKTLFHEMGHSTGHKDRLARAGVMDAIMFGSVKYGLEELVADTCSAMLMGAAGLDDIMIEDTAAYCSHWLRAIRADRKAFASMAGHAVKAAQYILGETVDYEAKDEREVEREVVAAA